MSGNAIQTARRLTFPFLCNTCKALPSSVNSKLPSRLVWCQSLFFKDEKEKNVSGVSAQLVYIFHLTAWQSRKEISNIFQKSSEMRDNIWWMAMKPMRDGQAKIFSLHSALCRQLNLHCQSGKGKKKKKKKRKVPSKWLVASVLIRRVVATVRPSKELLVDCGESISGFIAQQQNETCRVFYFLKSVD